jgi:FemAB-related protein (PEP-CTERM system-associated)
MPEIETLTSENAKNWNSFVDANPAATPYHYAQWQFAIEQAYGHKSSGLLAKDEHQQIEGILPLVNFTSLKQSKHLCSLPFCDLGGPVAQDKSTRDALISQAEKLSPKGTVELRERATEQLAEESLDNYKTAKVSMLFKLPDSSETLLASFKPKLRSQIKKAEKNGLTARLVQDASLIDDFYHVISRNMRDLGSPVHSKAFFRTIMEMYGANAASALVYLDGEPTAAGLILMTPNNACIPWASSLREYNKLAPNMLLYWTFLAHVADKKIPIFDFGRSTINQGTYRFKKQWGAKPWLLTWHEAGKEQTEQTVETTSKARQFVETVWQKMPLAVTNAIGPQIRKHISL